MSDTTRQLKIQAGRVRRLQKELRSYSVELEQDQKRVAEMKEKGADSSDVRQAEHVAEDSAGMIGHCRQLLEAALGDIHNLLGEAEGEEGIAASEEFAAAKEATVEAEKVFEQYSQ
mmetsp:Transcript_21517/g.60581  ORF Transcript_21517/g.60581 Transcript_21517/m.60581 type:complete len:116 (+) Transcript_21517:1-348(+)